MRTVSLTLLLSALLLAFGVKASQAGFFDDLLGGVGLSSSPGSGLDDSTIIKGLKEALSTGTTRAVNSVSQQDGYFSNAAIKILLPEKVRSAADLLGKIGFQKDVDDFVLSMNRAAEKAAPQATEHIVTALKSMSFDDARKILQGDKTSATEYFKQKTGDKIFASFKPVVSESMKDVGVAKNYAQLKQSFEAIPFAGTIGAFDLEKYVTTKAVDGLFTMIGEEETKIRTNPAARGTELLKKVFGK
ncbi:MAG: DUF4197 domain-containing protein [Desulfuromonadales bacterium]|nr:DUF4197 domain-containing protein [Desulfuromonadales bacterium]